MVTSKSSNMAVRPLHRERAARTLERCSPLTRARLHTRFRDQADDWQESGTGARKPGEHADITHPATPSLRARDRAFVPRPCDCSPSTVRHLIGTYQENRGAYRADDGGKSLDRWRWLEHARSRSDSKQRRWQGAQIDARDRPVCKQVGEWGLNAEEDEAMKTRRERPSCVLSPPSPGQRPRGDLARRRPVTARPAPGAQRPRASNFAARSALRPPRTIGTTHV